EGEGAEDRNRRRTRRKREHHGGALAARRELHPGQLRAGTGSGDGGGRAAAGVSPREAGSERQDHACHERKRLPTSHFSLLTSNRSSEALRCVRSTADGS